MSSLTRWTSEEDMAFENAIALHYRADSDEWLQKIALLLPRKTLEEVKQHYEILVEDLKAIESGLVALPNYTEQNTSDDQHGCKGYDRLNYSLRIGFYGGPKGGSKSEQERRKGIPWTEEEHRLFLLGLDKYGKGDWRSISRNYVKSRTPTQVASHAQKYFIRLNSMKRDRRRSSIHDITTIKDTGQVSSPQGHVTGQKTYINNLSATAIGSSGKHWAPNMTGVGMYGAPMGCPVAAGSHMVSAVGTPVMLPTVHHPTHPPYVLPVAYPITPNMHQ